MGEILLFMLMTWAAKHWSSSPPRGNGRARQPPKRQIPPTRRKPAPSKLPPTQAPAPAASAPQPKPTLPAPSPAQAVKNASQPPPWPQAMPSGLPPWPQGWQPAQPPPAAVVTRAWQLLPTLWQKGAGNRTTEKTGTDWITYVATWMNPQKTTKGVTAFKPKGGAPRTPPRQPAGNA